MSVEGRRLVLRLRLRNLLSYGPESDTIALEPLNVVIGPNAGGKSNLIEALSLLQAAPRDLAQCIRDGGGIAEWLWKGRDAEREAVVETVIATPGSSLLSYHLCLAASGPTYEVSTESVGYWDRAAHVVCIPLYTQRGPEATFHSRPDDEAVREERQLPPGTLNPRQSILSQRRDPDQYPELTYLADQFARIRLYREWGLGRRTAARLPQPADLPEDFLLESGENIGMVINDMQHRHVPAMGRIVGLLRRFHDGLTDISTRVQGGTVQLFFHERGLSTPVPATRISDGTLRYLCLLTILCHPEPPPLICIEEPELGLHPDIIPIIGELLIDAAQRTQLVVTTHSDRLVSALSEVPEAVLICERTEQGSQLRRLEPDKLKEWLEKYSLGELWAMGEIGGNRW